MTLDTNTLRHHLVTAISAAFKAGDVILEVYDSDFAVEYKDDRSPLTLADKRSHAIIADELEMTAVPILSEEGRHLPYDERKSWPRCWLVDPLDGTKEFIKRNGEFTVNIAMIEGKRPVMGVLYVPVRGLLYFSLRGSGAYRANAAKDFREKLNSGLSILDGVVGCAERLPIATDRRIFTIVGSRSHMSKETEEYIDTLRGRHRDVDLVSRGSSLKLCMIAEGAADIYPRFAPTMEWDTAAGQAIVEATGGSVLKTNEIDPLEYNKEDLVNPWFVAKTAGQSRQSRSQQGAVE